MVVLGKATEDRTMLSITRYSIQNKHLSPWVKFIWCLEAQQADIRLKLLPTDSIDVILSLSGDIVYETTSHMITAPLFHINGLRSEHSYIRQSGNARIFGISFYAFGLYPFIYKPLEGIKDDIIDLYSLSLPLAHTLQTVVSHGSTQDIIGNIEKALGSVMSVTPSFVDKSKLIRNFIESDESVSIHSFCAEHGINIKTFERAALRYTGYTPKVLRRVRRFQAASNQLMFQRSADLAEVAYDNSFFDQSHFTKEFRRFSGAVPRTFLREKITVKENTAYSFA